MRTNRRHKSDTWLTLWRRISQTGTNPGLSGSRSLERRGRNEFWTASARSTSSPPGSRTLDHDATPRAARGCVFTAQLRDSAERRFSRSTWSSSMLAKQPRQQSVAAKPDALELSLTKPPRLAAWAR